MRVSRTLILAMPLLAACDSTPIFRASPRALPGGELVQEGPLPGRPADQPPPPPRDIWARELPGDDATFEVAPEDAAAVFDAARDVFRDHAFVLARVDAAGGVLSTWARQSAGFATAHLDDESTFAESAEGFFNTQRRRARLVFEPLDESGVPPRDFRDPDAPLIARVQVIVERLNTQGRAASTVSIRRSHYFVDATRPGPSDIVTPLRRDGALAGRLAQEIQQRAAAGAIKPVGQSPEPATNTP